MTTNAHQSSKDQSGSEFAAQPSQKLEIATATVSMLVAAFFVYASTTIKSANIPGQTITASWWPTGLSTIGLLLSVGLLVVSITEPPPSRTDLNSTTKQGYLFLAITIALTFIYVQSWNIIGFNAATFIYLVALLWLYGARTWVVILGYPLLTTAVLYLIFGVLLRVAI